MRKWGVWVEPLFGEAEQFHKLRQYRLRDLLKSNIEGVVTAAGQNLKQLIKYMVEGEELLQQTWTQIEYYWIGQALELWNLIE